MYFYVDKEQYPKRRGAPGCLTATMSDNQPGPRVRVALSSLLPALRRMTMVVARS
ncbi:MAG: hypothetical protein QOE34_2449 [Verrucomicrobiota bacterium]|jgi:hypothetical protein